MSSFIDSDEEPANRKYGHRSTLASRCQSIAFNLSFNTDSVEGEAKQALIEASHALDALAVRVHQKKDGLLIINARGKARFMTWRERIAYRLLGSCTAISL